MRSPIFILVGIGVKIRNPLFTQRASQEMMKRKLLFLLLRDLLGRSFLFGFLNGHDMVLLS
jgi:hypothetical protein